MRIVSWEKYDIQMTNLKELGTNKEHYFSGNCSVLRKEILNYLNAKFSEYNLMQYVIGNIVGKMICACVV